jgi:hypothetical protein
MQVADSNMVDKKGFMRTLESMIAILGSLFFVLFILPDTPSDVEPEETIRLLEVLSQENEFRNCVLISNVSCVDGYISTTMNLGEYQYTFNISSDHSYSADINRDDVYLKTVFIAGNETLYSPKILKLYYWNE